MNNAKIVYLYFNKIKVGELAYIENKYWYRVNEKKLPLAQNVGCDTSYLYVGKEDKRCNVTDKLPYIFEQFNFSNSRMDLIMEYDINDIDNEFDKLYKVACRPELLFHNGFWIWTV